MIIIIISGPKKKIVLFHGDLTIENAIFFKKKLFLIDWENSRKNLPWGLDICYFLISTLVLPQMYSNYKKKNLSELKSIIKKYGKTDKEVEKLLKNEKN